MTKEEIRTLIKDHIRSHPKLDLRLMQALVEVESSYDPWGVKYEPKSPYLNNVKKWADKHGLSFDTERNLQKTSWGLFQLMGVSARDIGFQENLTKLLIPEVNIIWGLEFFKIRCQNRYSDIADQIAAYNRGTPKKTRGIYTNQLYVNKVLAAYQKYQDLDK